MTCFLCKKGFATATGLTTHLESGGCECAPNLNRDTVYRVVRHKDPNGAISKNLHILTMYIWIVLRLFQAIDAHSGYEFPWSLHHFLPFWAGAEHHDVHHEKFIGNYASSFRWWDYVLDTESGPEAAKRRRERKLAKLKKAQGKAQ